MIYQKDFWDYLAVFLVPCILVVAYFLQRDNHKLVSKKRKDDLFQLRFHYFKRLIAFWKQTTIELNLTDAEKKYKKR